MSKKRRTGSGSEVYEAVYERMRALREQEWTVTAAAAGAVAALTDVEARAVFGELTGGWLTRWDAELVVALGRRLGIEVTWRHVMLANGGEQDGRV